MNRLNSVIVVSVIAASSTLTNDASAQIPEGFEVVVLANDLGFHERPAIGNDSSVSWSSSFCHNNDPNSTVVLYADGRIRELTDGTMNDNAPGINNVGTIAWKRTGDCLFPAEELAVYKDGVIWVVPDTPALLDSPKLNDNGWIVWSHDFSGNAGHVELFLYDGESILQITSNGISNQIPRINNDAWITWGRTDFDAQPRIKSIMLYRDGEITQLAGGPGSRGPPDLNDLGQIVWSDGALGIVLWEDGQSQVVIEDGIEPSINNRGDIFFRRWNEGFERWDVWMRVDGKEFTVPDTEFGMAGGDLNDRAEAAWRAWVNDFGDTAIFMLRRIAPPGDMDHDCHADFADFQAFQICFTGADNGPPGGLLGDCTRSDLDGDGDVDNDDFDVFLGAFTGPGAVVPGCQP